MLKKQQKLMKMATLASVLVALTIIIIKLIAWIATDSLSLLSSLVDSFLDVAASMVSFVAVRYSLQPADEDHRFGHGKAEDIAAFAQSTFIAGSGLFIVVEAISRFITPHPVTNEVTGIIVMVAASVLTLALIAFQLYVVRQTNSSAIKADSLHYQTDLLVNILVIGSFVASMFFDISFADPVLAVFIAIYILKSAYKVGRGAFDNLMDKEFSDEERTVIMDVILSNPDIKGVHDLRTRHSGLQQFIQFHIELDAELKLSDAHSICDAIEAEINKIYPSAEIFIHQDTDEVDNIALEKGRAVPVKK